MPEHGHVNLWKGIWNTRHFIVYQYLQHVSGQQTTTDLNTFIFISNIIVQESMDIYPILLSLRMEQLPGPT